MIRLLCVLVLLGLSIEPKAQAAEDGAAVLAILGPPGPLSVAGETLDRTAVSAFYRSRGFALAWNDGTDRPGLGPRTAAIFDALASAADEGLDPADYHVGAMSALAASAAPRARIERDLLITDGLLRYIADQSGRRLEPTWSDQPTKPDTGRPIERLSRAAALRPEALNLFLEEIAPDRAEYAALKAALGFARRAAEAGGWAKLPEGSTIHPGDRDPAVPALRLRLAAEGAKISRPHDAADFTLYDKRLVEAVAAFQRCHGLKGDGVIGADTREALDLSAQARVDQVVAGLERARGSSSHAAGRRIEVNIARYWLEGYDDGDEVALSMPVVVGKAERMTPILESRITKVIVNPSWTVPPTILVKDILPRLAENADYLSVRGLERHQLGDGRVRLVQPPGPSNPLGRYKFVLSNPFDVYLHDSPESGKFSREIRTLSSGCIRVGDARSLAIFLLNGKPSFASGRLDEIVDGTTHTISLDEPVPVSIVYRTAWLDPRGQLILGDDPYGRDQRLVAALKKTHSVHVKSPKRMCRPGVMSLLQ